MGRQENRTYGTTLLHTLPQKVVPLVLDPALNLLANVLRIADNIFPMICLNSDLVSLLLLVGRTNSTSGLLAGASRLDGRIGETVSGVGEEVAEEVEGVGEEVAELGGGKEDGEEGVEGLAGFLEFVFRGDGDAGKLCSGGEGRSSVEVGGWIRG